MADNFNIVLRWTIANATARAATGRIESEVFHKGGYKWTIVAEKHTLVPNDLTDFTLLCDMDHNGPWKCEAEVNMRLCYGNGGIMDNCCKKEIFVFNETTRSWKRELVLCSGTNINDSITFEFRVRIIRSERREPIADPAIFAAPNRRSDVILKIGEAKLHVSKEILAIHSPVFETLFFGDFAEKGKEEVELKDVDYQEFSDLLNFIYARTREITDQTVVHFLKLADQFQMEEILNQSKNYLIQSKGFDVMKKLMIADEYRLIFLRDHCLKSFASVNEVKQKLLSFPEYDNLSGDMKIAICDRISKLPLQMTDNSNIVLHWEVDNAAALATGTAKSEVFSGAEFEWKIGVQPNDEYPTTADLMLTCDNPRGGKWRCDAGVELVEPFHMFKVSKTFNDVERVLNFKFLISLSYLTEANEHFNINGKVTIEFRVNIISSECSPMIDLAKFSSPNEMSNVTLVIGEKKVKVSKDMLAIHSPVFAAMFFGDFVEKGKEEVELKNVVYEEHLMNSSRFSAAKKLLLADQYRLTSLKDHCLQSFTSVNRVTRKLMSSPEYARFSGDMKIAICDRIAELSRSVR